MLKIYDSDEEGVGARCELRRNKPSFLSSPLFSLPLRTRLPPFPNLSEWMDEFLNVTEPLGIHTVCLHSAFQYPGLGSDEVRESFEVRAMVFDAADE